MIAMLGMRPRPQQPAAHRAARLVERDAILYRRNWIVILSGLIESCLISISIITLYPTADYLGSAPGFAPRAEGPWKCAQRGSHGSGKTAWAVGQCTAPYISVRTIRKSLPRQMSGLHGVYPR